MPLCGLTRDPSRKNHFCCGSWMAGIGIALSQGLILYFIMGATFDAQIRDKVIIDSAAEAEALNKLPQDGEPIPTTTYYIYNLTNEAEAMTGSEPIFESVGPFVYKTKVGKSSSTYDAATGQTSFNLRVVQDLEADESIDLDSVVTNLDAIYAGAFGAAVPGLTESTLALVTTLGYIQAIDVNLIDYLPAYYYATELGAYIAAGSGNETTFYSDKFTTISTHYGEVIDSMRDLVYAQWGGSAMIADGVDLSGSVAGQGAIATNANNEGLIATTLLTGSYLSSEQITTITTAFSSDTNFFGLGIYQTMHILNTQYSAPICRRLTIAEVTSIMSCYYNAECGLVAVGAFAADTGDNTMNAYGLSLFNLSISDTDHICYITALMSYPTMMLPLFNHFFTSRLKAEKGVNDIALEKRTVRQLLEGYNSATLNALAQPAAVAPLLINHSTAALADAANLNFVLDTGVSDIRNMNKIREFQGVTGFDYNGDGTTTDFVGSFDGLQFPPNQKGMLWEPVQSQYDVFDYTLYKACTVKQSSDVVKLGPFQTPKFWRDETACYADDTDRATTKGYQSIRHILGANVYMTAPCMYGYEDQKLWKDDCVASQNEHGSYIAIDSLSGAPWEVQRSAQTVVGFDVSQNSYDGTGTGLNTNYRYPLMRAKIFLSLDGLEAGVQLQKAYSFVFLLKDKISWASFGVGMFLTIAGNTLVFYSIKKVDKTVPVNEPQEMKPAA